MTRSLLVALALVGCVGKGKYDALLADRDALQSDYDQYKTEAAAKASKQSTKIQNLETALEDAKRMVTRLNQQIEDLKSNVSALQEEKATLLSGRANMRASIDQMKAAIAELEARKAKAEARVREFRDLLERFKSLIDAGKLKVKIVNGRMVVELATDILFASGSAALSKEGKAAIEEVAAVLSSIPERKYQVEGHTDNDPIATKQYPSNWELAAGRALTVMKTLIAAGLPPERVSAASYGETRPVADNETKEGKAANRRIEIVIVPDLSNLPGFEELSKIEGGG